MSLSVIGCDHPGVVHAACMANIGQKVLGVDIDEVEAEMLNSGKAWFRGPGLDEMLIRRSLLQRGAFMNYRHKTRGACRTGKAR